MESLPRQASIYDGRWAAVEIKLRHREVDDAARNLLRLRDGRVDTARAGEPMMLAVVLSTGLSYMREDGVPARGMVN